MSKIYKFFEYLSFGISMIGIMRPVLAFFSSTPVNWDIVLLGVWILMAIVSGVLILRRFYGVNLEKKIKESQKELRYKVFILEKESQVHKDFILEGKDELKHRYRTVEDMRKNSELGNYPESLPDDFIAY